ncbi:MAG: TlpA family protein disulfide reductase [Chlorobium sp.]|jgi:peroxiredoxin|uniref:TlpA family protein disulfide reductase n=1 Tax=Chlorobium sp. TaxID=1095 RepID=UPI001DBD5406|nr:TlpA disulfide reductase family protein [Chlorobium sp.]MBN1278313.1 TlpA family protein disulfide reductase [Chlorobiaceae bacterium]MCF8216875.1 TlpA family protein disulfide reductase [Chlorobium sp.]MCF8271704.1 TlpA family protein disulfide reductase [Chlorobium sp.]MCF8288092.1 TlpA family protein disulfide reductase [Chlorobium sp.]MCF8291683.1 TlpA family protein disulfide reductase [Chlorobium sp.]
MSKMKKMAAGPAVFMAALLILFTVGIAGAAQSPVAPAFSGTGMDGKTVSSGQLAGKAYIVNFFASWCPPCRAEIPDMVELQKKYGVKGFTFIGAAVNENEVSIKKFMKANGITYPVILADQKIVSAYSRYVPGGLRSIPTTFVVDRSGKITRVFSGVRSKADFEKMILDALKPVKAVK